MTITIKDAIFKCLEDFQKPSSYMEVYKQMIDKSYYEFKNSKTPESTVSAILGEFIRHGDTRVKRIKVKGIYLYYLTKFEGKLELDTIEIIDITDNKKQPKVKSFDERSLHKLLSSYLKNSDTFSKTIFHESSQNSKDGHQKWVHPDMIGIKFLNLKTKASQVFLKATNRIDTFRLTSYELKKEINTDYELKKCFFQAVSNSSWANFGYLVAFEINDNLIDEMERLNQSFGIGIIELRANPYESKILFQAKYKELDYKTIDKLCNINIDFSVFIEKIEALMTATEKYHSAAERELNDFCDTFLADNAEISKYCKENNIPFDDTNE